MDYFVPNFGVDQDILDAQKHEADADKFLAKRKFVKDAPEGKETKSVTSMKDQDEKLKKEADDKIKEISGEAKKDAKEEKEEKKEAKKEGKTEAKNEAKTEAKEEAKTEAKAQGKEEAKVEAKADAKEEAPPAAAATLMIKKSSDPICSSDPTDPAC